MIKMPYVCRVKGIAIKAMCNGFSKIVFAWKPKSNATVASRPTIEKPSDLLKGTHINEDCYI